VFHFSRLFWTSPRFKDTLFLILFFPFRRHVFPSPLAAYFETVPVFAFFFRGIGNEGRVFVGSGPARLDFLGGLLWMF